MRLLQIITLCFLLLNLSACVSAQKSKQNALAKTEEKVLVKVDSTKGVARKIFIHKNKKLDVFERNGALAYTIAPNEQTTVIRFSYEKDMDKVAYDGGYREEVVFEVPNTTGEHHYEDVELQNLKMLFGRYCFCRGKTGLYKVKKGKLHVTSAEKGLHFELEFKIDEVPQVVTEVKY